MDPFEFRPWYPRGVKHFTAAGANNYIAIFDEKTVLKFPLVPPAEKEIYPAGGLEHRKSIRKAAVKGLEVEEQILHRLGQHPRIIRLVQKHEDGLLLEYMPNGSVERYLRNAAEGLAYVHGKNVLHCDFSIGNLLLDSDLAIKICDFQGRLLAADGSVMLDGGAAESTMSSMPRPDLNECNRKTDIFALGTAIYIMVTGQLPFPDLDPVDDEDAIRGRFKDGDFPLLEQRQGGDVVRNCWVGYYEWADEIVLDLQVLERL